MPGLGWERGGALSAEVRLPRESPVANHHNHDVKEAMKMRLTLIPVAPLGS